MATESILPKAWGYDAMDAAHLKSIHKRFGERLLKSFPIVSFWDYNIYYPYIRRMKVIAPLNYMPYNKDKAIAVLEKEFGWQYYGGKHYESRFTKFFQSYYLPTRFGYDKRKPHLSSLIVSGQVTREDALLEIKKEPYSTTKILEDIVFLSKKLGISEDEFKQLMDIPKKVFFSYPSNYYLTRFVRGVLKVLRNIRHRLVRSWKNA